MAFSHSTEQSCTLANVAGIQGSSLALPPSQFTLPRESVILLQHRAVVADQLRTVRGLLAHPEWKLRSWRTCWLSAFPVPAPSALSFHLLLLFPPSPGSAPCSAPLATPQPYLPSSWDFALRCVSPGLLWPQEAAQLIPSSSSGFHLVISEHLITSLHGSP